MRRTPPLKCLKGNKGHHLTHLPTLSNVTNDSPNFSTDEYWIKSPVRSCPEICCFLFRVPVVNNASYGKRLKIQAASLSELRAC